ncbi:MAG TPA: Co2+/Mg2+ efflux protein ApaG, partial [Halieaceae bacterium]|nr:Co2+/Mg2+ efflux protein ApaG [Halieaceae bacterium]
PTFGGITLLRRFWKICDANGKVDEVEGAGVVGETPTLKPGDYYDYSSAANFETPIGFMEGYYTFQILDQMGEFPNTCTVPIPRFTLAKPNALH